MPIQNAAQNAIRNLQFNKQLRQQADEGDKNRALTLTQMGQGAIQDASRADDARNMGLMQLANKVAERRIQNTFELDQERLKQGTEMAKMPWEYAGKVDPARINARSSLDTTAIKDNTNRYEANLTDARERDLANMRNANALELADRNNAAAGQRARTIAGGRGNNQELASVFDMEEAAIKAFTEAGTRGRAGPRDFGFQEQAAGKTMEDNQRAALSAFKAARARRYQLGGMPPQDAERAAHEDTIKLANGR